MTPPSLSTLSSSPIEYNTNSPVDQVLHPFIHQVTLSTAPPPPLRHPQVISALLATTIKAPSPQTKTGFISSEVSFALHDIYTCAMWILKGVPATWSTASHQPDEGEENKKKTQKHDYKSSSTHEEVQEPLLRSILSSNFHSFSTSCNCILNALLSVFHWSTLSLYAINDRDHNKVNKRSVNVHSLSIWTYPFFPCQAVFPSLPFPINNSLRWSSLKSDLR